MPDQGWRAVNVELARKISRESAVRCRVRLKAEMIAAYGGGCTCCGVTEHQFLSMDHLNGRTAEDNLRGEALWRHAKKLGWPDAYSVRCHNCNLGRSINGGICPHEALDVR